MSSRIFQSMVVQMKEATSRPIGVVDSEGNVVASSELSLMGTHIADVNILISAMGEKFSILGGKTFKVLPGPDMHFDYAVFVDGTDETAASFCIMAAIAVSSAKA